MDLILHIVSKINAKLGGKTNYGKKTKDDGGKSSHLYGKGEGVSYL